MGYHQTSGKTGRPGTYRPDYFRLTVVDHLMYDHWPPGGNSPGTDIFLVQKPCTNTEVLLVGYTSSEHH